MRDRHTKTPSNSHRVVFATPPHMSDMAGRTSTNDAQHPRNATVGQDTDPNAAGDVVETVSVENSEALVIAVTSQDSEPLSASVEWVDDDTGAEFVTESAATIGLDSVTSDWARLVRKGPACVVTVTSEAGSGIANKANVWIDTQK